MIRRLRRWWRRFRKRLQYRAGWRRCPACRGWCRIRWVKDWVVHPEEPPLFYHYECSGCGATSAQMPSMLTEQAVRKLGYADFDEFARMNLKVEVGADGSRERN